MPNTPNLQLPLISASQSQKHVTANETFRILDLFARGIPIAKDRDLNTPPGSPVDGDVYIVGPAPTGAWASQAGKLTYYNTNVWQFFTPTEGWVVYLLDEDAFVQYTGSAWVGFPNTMQNIAQLGVNTTADATNKLAVASSAILFTHVGAGVQTKLNKSAASDTASFLFQTGFSGRAEFGTIGSDDFSFKVSPDGTNFFTGVRAHRNLHGRFALKSASRLSAIELRPSPNSAVITSNGIVRTDIGTLTAVAPSSSNYFTAYSRSKWASAASAGSSCGFSPNGLSAWRGNAAGLGGFYLLIRGGIETYQTDARMFLGLYASTSAIGNVDPSTLLDMVGIGCDGAQTTLRVFHNDGAGAATAVDLGASFPTNSGQTMYEAVFSAETNGSDIKYRVENLNSGVIAEGTLSTNLPTNTVFMGPHMWYNNNATAAAVELAIGNLYLESASALGSRGVL